MEARRNSISGVISGSFVTQTTVIEVVGSLIQVKKSASVGEDRREEEEMTKKQRILKKRTSILIPYI